MGLARLVTRRGNTSLVLGMAVSLGVVVLASTALGWRRTKKTPEGEAGVEEQAGPEQEALWAERAGAEPEDEPGAEPESDDEAREPEPAAASPPREYRFKPAPERERDAPRWDTPPSALNDGRGP
jgi:hypothetical protein